MKITEDGGLRARRGALSRSPNENRAARRSRSGRADEVEAAIAARARAARGAPRARVSRPRRSTDSAAASIAIRSTRSSRSRAVRRASRFCCSSPDRDMIERLDLHLPAYAANLAARHWPGPLTLVLAGGERRVPDGCAVRKAASPFGGRATPASAVDPRARRRDHVDEREPSRGFRRRCRAARFWSSGATRSRAERCGCSTAGRSSPSQAVDGGRLHGTRCRASFARARSRPRRCARACPTLIGDA